MPSIAAILGIVNHSIPKFIFSEHAAPRSTSLNTIYTTKNGLQHFSNKIFAFYQHASLITNFTKYRISHGDGDPTVVNNLTRQDIPSITSDKFSSEMIFAICQVSHSFRS
jgi:hypothetical protein